MIGKMFEGRWKVEKRERINSLNSYHYRYLLVNIYNEQRMWISDKQLTALNNNTLTISKIRSQRIRRFYAK